MSDKKELTGRPTKYKPEYDEQVRKLCMLGAIDREIANFFNVAESTYYEWQEKHPTFRESIKEGKVIADIKVSEALFKKATGFEVTKTKFATEGGKITDEKLYREVISPDTTACIFWLKNRQSEQWREKQEVLNTTLNEEGEEVGMQINIEFTGDK
jgi:hypothetical protein